MIPAIQMTEGPVRVSPGDICCRVTDAWRHMRRTVVGNSSKGRLSIAKLVRITTGKGWLVPVRCSACPLLETNDNSFILPPFPPVSSDELLNMTSTLTWLAKTLKASNAIS
ncbi:hypothetical protein RvY_08153-2 [Ramazzottius varieornatus]|uniref:Uncharacterized protein n=1 Tax=Ramazzottius varieornatus TaxID=947166 RepID=A0A1D1VE16_RAMVA|nr:hypothetical protein RvY_08153-2 [Ramazzottius varieornatus]